MRPKLSLLDLGIAPIYLQLLTRAEQWERVFTIFYSLLGYQRFRTLHSRLSCPSLLPTSNIVPRYKSVNLRKDFGAQQYLGGIGLTQLLKHALLACLR